MFFNSVLVALSMNGSFCEIADESSTTEMGSETALPIWRLVSPTGCHPRP
jgi:hypothetical protein